MIGISLAFLAAVAFGLSVVLVRRDLDKSNVLNAIFAVTLIGNIILWPLALFFTDLKTAKSEGLLLFAAAGAFAPGIGRLLYYKGVKILGPSLNASIFATYPMYSSIMAALLLNETLSTANFLGIACALIGAVIIERSWSKDKIKPGKVFQNLAFPIMATLSVAVSQVVRKYGLGIYNAPLLGVAVGYACSLLIYALALLRLPISLRTFSWRKELGYFWKAGVGLSIGWLLAFFALSLEKVSIVTPLLQTESLFIIFFSHVFLKKIDEISVGLVFGSLIVVFGVALVSMK
ncbi:MAG: DMT family transporter [Candidatus Bathyarchaeota archaeon]|nr:MAG: DMT family transporter [Candidatus Bathyarchaeota archaeon]